MFINGWFFEEDVPLSVAIKVKEYLFTTRSKYQKIDVFDSIAMGKVLLLDDMVMVTEKDEFYYHENIVHPVLSIHKEPKHIMVIGGGDGGTVREALKYKSVEEVELIEIDEEVINISKKFFPEVSLGLNNPKVKIKNTDAIEYIKTTRQNYYDVIICDSTDPNPDSIAGDLISKDFYINVSKILKTDGIYISQNGSPILQEKLFEQAIKNMRLVFKYVDCLTSICPSYPGGYLFAFLIASNLPIDRKVKNIPAGKTKFWNQDIHHKLFTKPNWLEEKYFSLQETKR